MTKNNRIRLKGLAYAITVVALKVLVNKTFSMTSVENAILSGVLDLCAAIYAILNLPTE